jgi:hypothetical protein
MNASRIILVCVAVVAAAFTTLTAGQATAFPPYRSTDAAPAEPWELEPRLGLLMVEREAGENEWTAPLFRVNLGFPGDFEAITEAELKPDSGELSDAAVGVKWIPLRRSFALGVEMLVLPPLPSRPGAGVEATTVASIFAQPMRLHVNLLGEVETGPLRPGLEIAMKTVRGEPSQIAAGGGAILNLGAIDLRAGVHLGLTADAPDIRASFWVTSKLPLAGD